MRVDSLSLHLKSESYSETNTVNDTKTIFYHSLEETQHQRFLKYTDS